MAGPYEQALAELLSVAGQAEVIASKLRALRHDADVLMQKVQGVYRGVATHTDLDGECRFLATSVDRTEVCAERIVTIARETAARLGGAR